MTRPKSQTNQVSNSCKKYYKPMFTTKTSQGRYLWYLTIVLLCVPAWGSSWQWEEGWLAWRAPHDQPTAPWWSIHRSRPPELGGHSIFWCRDPLLLDGLAFAPKRRWVSQGRQPYPQLIWLLTLSGLPLHKQLHFPATTRVYPSSTVFLVPGNQHHSQLPQWHTAVPTQAMYTGSKSGNESSRGGINFSPCKDPSTEFFWAQKIFARAAESWQMDQKDNPMPSSLFVGS